jgi:DNA-binding LacI/PurR family transcriptional regulator
MGMVDGAANDEARAEPADLGRRPTSTDVSLRAGVSRATVSYVLNGQQKHSIPEATRTRVLDAAKALGYTPHAAARALRGGQSNIVLLAVRGVPYGRNLGILVDRVSELVAAESLTLVVWRPVVGESLRSTLGNIQPRMALSHLPLEDDEVLALKSAGVPYAAAIPSMGVSLTDELIGTRQVHHLAERGHRVIGYLSTGDGDVAGFAVPRRAGVRRGCLEMGLPAPLEAMVPVPPKGSVDEIVAVLQRWRDAPEPVTGVAAYNDYVAVACYQAAARLGLRVPEDLAVVGVDDEPFAAVLDPPLTSVRMDLIQLADRLVALARAAAGLGEQPPPLPSLSVEVIARGST